MKNQDFIEQYDLHAPDEAAKARMLQAAYAKAEQAEPLIQPIQPQPIQRPAFITIVRKHYKSAAGFAAAVAVLFGGLLFFAERDESNIENIANRTTTVSSVQDNGVPPTEPSELTEPVDGTEPSDKPTLPATIAATTVPSGTNGGTQPPSLPGVDVNQPAVQLPQPPTLTVTSVGIGEPPPPFAPPTTTAANSVTVTNTSAAATTGVRGETSRTAASTTRRLIIPPFTRAQSTTASVPVTTPVPPSTTRAPATSVLLATASAPSTTQVATTAGGGTVALTTPAQTTASFAVTTQGEAHPPSWNSNVTQPQSTMPPSTASAPSTTRTASTTAQTDSNRGEAPVISLRNETLIKSAYVAFLERSLVNNTPNGTSQGVANDSVSLSDLTMWYYGTYNGNSVVVFHVPGRDYSGGARSVTVAGQSIHFANSGYELLVYTVSGEFMDIRDAFSAGLLTVRDVEDIKYYTNPWEFQ